MNLLRNWGGGSIPGDDFYSECDRRGILVWHDFMFGKGKYPSKIEEFTEECTLEMAEVVSRLRNHPCILLWCGGNENHMGWDFDFGTPLADGWDLFDRIMPDICTRLDPDRYYHPSSPFGGDLPNSPLEGDWHDYSTLKFLPHASVPLFDSEIGRTSAPPLSSMRRFIGEEDLWPDGFDAGIRKPGQAGWPPMWEYRSSGSWDKIGPIEEYCDPDSADDLVRVLGTAHGEYLQRRIHRLRRGVPDGTHSGAGSAARRNWGVMTWRLNDTWPIIFWSLIDYYLQPKIPYYFTRRSYTPVLISFERTADRISVWVTNDSADSIAGNLMVRRMTFDGEVLGEISCRISSEPGSAQPWIDASAFGHVIMRSEFLRAQLDLEDGAYNIESTFLLIGERYLHLPDTQISAMYRDGTIVISARHFARQVCLEADGTAADIYFSDNYFDLPPGREKIIEIIGPPRATNVRIKALNSDECRLELRSRI